MFVSCKSISSIEVQGRSNTILYRNVKNPILILTNDTEDISVASNHGKLTKERNDLYWLETYDLKPVILTVTKGGKTKEFNFQTYKIPDPTIYFVFNKGQERYSSTNNNTYKTEKFKKIKSIQASIDAFNYSCSYSITSFRIIILKKNGEKIYKNRRNTNYINLVMVEAGDVVIFSEIMITFNDDTKQIRRIGDVPIFLN